jgi:hypothetical protein
VWPRPGDPDLGLLRAGSLVDLDVDGLERRAEQDSKSLVVVNNQKSQEDLLRSDGGL